MTGHIGSSGRLLLLPGEELEQTEGQDQALGLIQGLE